ncbi:MAG: TonB-dependent receptor, partial [Myxococcales bacterium]|nr:TonB-dependent receptor [Myxococcales bacterium]
LLSALAAEPTQDPDAFDEDDISEVVVVSATRSPSALGDAPVAVEVITRAEIEATGSESLGELLEEQPGLQIDDTVSGTAIRMQGMDPEHTLILVDGQRVLGQKDGTIDLSRFTMENIERIEIVKGPSSSLYGSDAMGGVVHIITRRPADAVEGGVHLRAGTLGRIDLSGDVGYGGPVFKHQITSGWHQADAWDLDPSDEATTASAYEQGDVSYALTAKPAADVEVTFDASYLQRRMAGVNQALTGATFDNLALVEDARAAVGGWWTPSASSKLSWRMSGSIYRAQQLNDQRGSAVGDNFADEREQLGEGSLQLDQIVGDHTLSVGVDGLHQDITSQRLVDGKGARLRGAVFAQDLWRVGGEDRLHGTISPGFRVDVDSQFGVAPTPRIATALVKDATTVRLSVGTGFRAPNFRELYLDFENPGAGYVIAGTPDLRPERSTNLNASVAWAKDHADTSFQLYRNDISNLINIGTIDQEAGSDLLFGYVNIDRAVTQGLDAQIRWRPDPFVLEVGYAYTDARDKARGRRLEGRVPHRLTGSAKARLARGLSARTQVGIASPRPFYVDANGDGIEENTPTPSRVTLDARAVYKTGAMELFAGIDNIFGVGQQTLAPTIPRFVYAGLNLRGRADTDGGS